jgi:hypothetical protein
MDQLARSGDRSQVAAETLDQVERLRITLGRSVLPRQAITERPRVVAEVDEVRTRQVSGVMMEGIAGFLDPVNLARQLGISTSEEDAGRPSVHRPATRLVGRMRLHRLSEPDIIVGAPLGVHLAHPPMLGGVAHRFEDDPAIGPGDPLTASKSFQGLLMDTECLNCTLGRSAVAPARAGYCAQI